LTPAGIEAATFRFVAQHLNHCATAVPRRRKRVGKSKKRGRNRMMKEEEEEVGRGKVE
jgi:hypothetical protein